MGALCAPVVAAAVLVKPNCHKIEGVRDSKTLSARQRERVVGQIKRRVLAWGVGAASVAEIERLNIYHASHLAMRRALARLPDYDHVLVDGRKIVGFEAHVGPYTSIVDGDASSYAIACASIIAKVTRDRLMTRLAARYPGYGWEHNAGYTTRSHVAGLRELGLTPHHRRTYARIRGILEGDQMALDLLAGEGALGDQDDALAVDGVDPGRGDLARGDLVVFTIGGGPGGDGGRGAAPEAASVELVLARG
ncbi:MAG: ribonuclease [Chloroflexota bacterium]|jgi:ribonuclease HII|nr:ribonuclease [Chloroflexota bacterium]